MAGSLAKHKDVEEPHIDVGSAGRHSSLNIFKTLQPENLSCATNCLPSGQVFQPKTGQSRDPIRFNQMQQDNIYGSMTNIGSSTGPMSSVHPGLFMTPPPPLPASSTNLTFGQRRDPIGFNQMQQDNIYGSMTNIGSSTGPMGSVHPGQFMTPPPPLPASSTNLTFGQSRDPMQFNKMQQSIPVMGSPRRPMDLGKTQPFLCPTPMQQSIPVMGSPRRPMELGKTQPFMCPTPFLEGTTNPALGKVEKPSYNEAVNMRSIREESSKKIDIPGLSGTVTVVDNRFTEEENNFTKMGMIVRNILADASYDLLKLDVPNLPLIRYSDVTKLYKKHRKLNQNIPSNGWGKRVYNTDISLGDDIERIRVIRNYHEHSSTYYLSAHQFKDLCNMIYHLLKRFDEHIQPAELYTYRLDQVLDKT